MKTQESIEAYDKIKPKNQYELVLFYLLKRDKFSLKDLINDSMFFKFQTRLSELEKEYGQLAKRESVPFVNRFGHKSIYYVYSAIDKNKLLSVYNKMNRIEIN